MVIDDLVRSGKAVEFLRVELGFHEGDALIEVSGAGDVNGDGYADFLLGDHPAGRLQEGVTFLVFGAAALPSTIELASFPEPGDPDGVTRIYGAGDMANSGLAVGPAGDFNGDGHDDFFVGSLSIENPFNPGNVTVIFGAAELPASIELREPRGRGLKLEGINATSVVSGKLKSTGDLNADGLDDFAFSETPAIPIGADPERGPGAVHVVYGLPPNVPFVRGDSTFEGAIDISDAIFILSYLFTGGEAPACADAADVDDTGDLVLTDAIYLLSHLFLGGRAPLPPYPEEGADQTEDGLDCRGF